MKSLAFLSTCALLALSVHANSGKGKTGYCESDDKCPATYACVSVQTTRSNVEDVKQCLPNKNNEVCGGTNPGVCPSFSTTWGEEFRQIASVCAFIVPNTKAKCVEHGTGNSSKNIIDCFMLQDPDDPTNSSAKIGVIYGCVDYDGSRLLFKPNDKSDKLAAQSNYSAIIDANCINPKNPSGSSFVCSSQGTCAPSNQGSMDGYACKCNVGFSGKYCQKIDDNACYNDGVCGGGTCDTTTMQCTQCKAGTTGKKCAECKPDAGVTLCSGHGQCVQATGDLTTLGAEDDDSTIKPTTHAPQDESSGSGDNNAEVGGGSGGANVSAGAGRVYPGFRRLATVNSRSTGTFQCKCDEGYSDVHCGVKAPVKKSNATTAPSTPSSAPMSMTLSLVAVVATAVVAVAL